MEWLERHVSKDVWSHARLVDLYLEHGLVDRARAEALSLRSAHPGSPIALYAWVRAHEPHPLAKTEVAADEVLATLAAACRAEEPSGIVRFAAQKSLGRFLPHQFALLPFGFPEADLGPVRAACGVTLDEWASRFERDQKLLTEGRWKELVATLHEGQRKRDAPSAEQLAALAILEGVDAVARFEPSGHTVVGAAESLAELQRYDLAEPLMRAAIPRVAHPGATARHADVLKMARPICRPDLPTDRPEALAVAAVCRVLAPRRFGDVAELMASSEAPLVTKRPNRWPSEWQFAFTGETLGPVLVADLVASGATWSVEHDGAEGYRVTASHALTDFEGLVVYLVGTEDALRVLSIDGPAVALAVHSKELLARGEVAQAARWLDWARGPATAEWRSERARLRDAKYVSGLPPWVEVWEADPARDPDTLATLAALAARPWRLRGAGQAAARARAAAPRDVTSTAWERVQATVLVASGQWKEAEPLARRLLSTPHRFEANLLLVEALAGLGQFEEAGRLLDESAVEAPDHVRLLVARARLERARGRHSAERQLLAQAVGTCRADFEDVARLLWLSVAVQRSADWLSLWRRCRDYDERRLYGVPGAHEVTLALAAASAQADGWADAMGYLTEASEPGRPGPVSSYVLALAAERLGEVDSARRHHEVVLKAKGVPAIVRELARRALAALPADGGGPH